MKKSNALPKPNGTNMNGFITEKQKATNNINLYSLSSDTCRMGGNFYKIYQYKAPEYHRQEPKMPATIEQFPNDAVPWSLKVIEHHIVDDSEEQARQQYSLRFLHYTGIERQCVWLFQCIIPQ